MTSGVPLTPEQRAAIERRMNAGEWPSVVARSLGISTWTVMNLVKCQDKAKPR